MSKAELNQKLDLLEVELGEVSRQHGGKGFVVADKARETLWLLVENKQLTIKGAVQMLRDQCTPVLKAPRPEKKPLQ